MHFKSINLNLVSSEYTHELVLFKQLLDWFLSEVVGALSFWILSKIAVLCIFIFHWISPHQITEKAIQRYLLESIHGINLLDQVEFW